MAADSSSLNDPAQRPNWAKYRVCAVWIVRTAATAPFSLSYILALITPQLVNVRSRTKQPAMPLIAALAGAILLAPKCNITRIEGRRSPCVQAFFPIMARKRRYRKLATASCAHRRHVALLASLG